MDLHSVEGTGAQLAIVAAMEECRSAFTLLTGSTAPMSAMGGDNYWPCGFMMGDELLRFVRSI